MKVSELWHSNFNSEWKCFDLDLINIPKNSLLIQSIESLISSGTEKKVLTTALKEKIPEKMKVPYMKGTFETEFTYGYSLLGEVVSGDVALVGKKVHLLHPHQSYAIVDPKDIFMVEEKSVSDAILISNLETVVNAIWDSGVSLGDTVLVVGFGIIGALLSETLLHFLGVEVFVSELNPWRKEKASHKFNIIDAEEEKKFDRVFHTSGTELGLQQSIDMLEKEGAVIDLSWYGNENVTLSLGKSFHYDRKKIIASQVSNIPHKKAIQWDKEKRKRLVMKLLEKGDYSEYIAETIAFSEAPSYYKKLRENKVNTIGTRIKY